METTLHRQLKDYYAGPDAQIEVKVGRYRIDIVSGKRLIEVQHSGLSSIRDKTRDLLKGHDVEVIKPLIARRRLIKLESEDGPELSRRWSPKRADRLDVFHELLYFTSVFPHRRLTLRIPLIEIEETRFPFRRRNRRRGQFKVGDQQLLSVVSEDVYRTRSDLRDLLSSDLPKTFGTREIADSMNVERWVAQRIAYVLRKTGTVRQSGKSGNSLQYQFVSRTSRKKAVTKKSTSLRTPKRKSKKSTRAA
ncbi:MAG: hypothetical protein ACR2NP_11310 [Pirellulaceae bacterium]